MDIQLNRKEFYTTVFAQEFSPCGNYLVTANNYGKIGVFNVTQALGVGVSHDSKFPVNVFTAHDGPIYCFTSSERYLISGGSKEIHGWLWKDIIHMKEKGISQDVDFKNQKPQPKWTFHPQSSSPFESPETNGLYLNEETNLLIAGCGDNNVYIWDITTGDLKQTFEGHTDYVQCIDFLPKTNQVLSGSEDGLVKFWDLRTNTSVEQIEPNKQESAVRRSIGHWVSCMAKDKTEDWLVIGGAAHSTVWHLRSKTCTAVLTSPESCAQSLQFVDDYILSGCSEPFIYKWSINGELRTKFPSTSRSVYSLQVNNQSNRVLAVSGNSCFIDLSTNFDYKAFCFTFKDSGDFGNDSAVMC